MDDDRLDREAVEEVLDAWRHLERIRDGKGPYPTRRSSYFTMRRLLRGGMPDTNWDGTIDNAVRALEEDR